MKNNYLYQGAYSELDDDIGWTDFNLRNYDAQIGRWVQQDPYQEYASSYVGMGNDPVSLIDPSGGSVAGPGGGLSTTAERAITLGEVIVRTGPIRSIASGVLAGKSLILTSGKLAGYALQAGRLINTDIITRSKGNASESTGQRQLTQKKIPNQVAQLKPGIRTAEAKAREEWYDGLSGFEKWKVDFNNQQDAVDQRVHEQMVNEVENSAGGSFPILGSWLKSGKYKLMGDCYNSEAEKSFKHALIEGGSWYLGGKIIGATFKYLRPITPEIEATITKSVGADINTTEQVLQRGGQTLTSKTLQALKLTKEQGRNAIHALKKDLNLGNDYHGVIRGNGDYYDTSNKIFLGNLHDYY